MPRSTLTSKGQVTIPKEIRDRLQLKSGDGLLFLVDREGNVLMRPEGEHPLGRLQGLLKHLAPARAATIEEMRSGLRTRARGKYRRSGKR